VGLLCAVVIVFGLIGVRLVDVQALGSDRYSKLGLDQRLQTIELAADRGSIFDRHGNDLAISIERQTVYADARVVDDPDAYAVALAPLVGVSAPDLAAKLAQKDKAFVYVARKVEDAVAEQVRALDLPGIGFVAEPARMYPSNALAGPVVGFVGTDNNGLSGLESQYEELLAGRPGEVVVERDPQGREIPSGERSVTPSKRGSDLVLTLDQSLQYETERVLVEEVTNAGALGGTAIVIDVQTGDILSMATVDGATDEAPAHPAPPTASNRPVTDVYEPGSTNKVITVSGAIEEGKVAPDTWFEVPMQITVDDVVFEDESPHPTSMMVRDIVRESSNVGTINIGRTLGRVAFDSYLRAFGFGSPTGLDFPGESVGIISPLEDYNDTSMASMPIGNGLAVTALQMLDVYTTIANGGSTRPPRLVDAIIDADGNRVEEPVDPSQPVVSPATAAAMTEMLEAVVAEGTGTNATIPGYRVAGKTGTARKPPYENPPYKYVASFAGFAPAEAPRFAAIVVLDEPGNGQYYGGEVAAPAFSRIMQDALRLQRVPPSDPGSTAAAVADPSTLNDSP
jgi:cell division protein FtsI (penicillin-binding protein 3)